MSPADRGVLLVVEQLRRRVPGGIGTYATGLARGLAGLPGGSRPPVRLLASRVRGADPLTSLGLPLDTIAVGSRALVKAWDLGALRVGRTSAVVHSVSIVSPPSTAPLVVTVHDLAPVRLPEAFPSRGRRWHAAALARATRRASFVVVPCEAVADDVRAHAPGLAADRVVVIEEGSDHLPPADHVAADVLLGRLGIVGGVLLAVGTLEPRKNLDRLLDAYSRARRRLDEPWPLLVVGPAGWGSRARSLPDGVVLAGRVPDSVLRALYERCRCLAYVPLLEGFGLPVVEAMRAGAPVVASPVPSAGGAALEVDPLDVESIANGLVAASSDEVVRRELVAAGHTRVSGLTWGATARAHVELWLRAAEER